MQFRSLAGKLRSLGKSYGRVKKTTARKKDTSRTNDSRNGNIQQTAQTNKQFVAFGTRRKHDHVVARTRYLSFPFLFHVVVLFFNAYPGDGGLPKASFSSQSNGARQVRVRSARDEGQQLIYSEFHPGTDKRRQREASAPRTPSTSTSALSLSLLPLPPITRHEVDQSGRQSMCSAFVSRSRHL